MEVNQILTALVSRGLHKTSAKAQLQGLLHQKLIF